MDIPEFEDLLGRHGEDVSSWPEHRRVEALALLRESDQARALLTEAGLLRKALRPEPVRAPDGLVDRIMRKVVSSDPAGKGQAKKPTDKS